jgi:hypothetical protein
MRRRRSPGGTGMRSSDLADDMERGTVSADFDEIPLAGGNVDTVVRVGDTVRRSSGPWTPTVHAFLRHLRSVGFAGCPEPLGIDDNGREILRYIEGDTVATGVPDIVRRDTLAEAASELRRVHDLSVGFDPPANELWRPFPVDAGPSEVICHSDWAPYNAVFRGGRLAAMIDWDFARPGSRLFDLAWLAVMWCPLAPPEDLPGDVAPHIDQPRRLREMCDAYGLSDVDGLLDMIDARVAGSIIWIETGAAEGDPARRKMREEGHAIHYRRLGGYLRDLRPRLEAALDQPSRHLPDAASVASHRGF